jgi:hypothetical protein
MHILSTQTHVVAQSCEEPPLRLPSDDVREYVDDFCPNGVTGKPELFKTLSCQFMSVKPKASLKGQLEETSAVSSTGQPEALATLS